MGYEISSLKTFCFNAFLFFIATGSSRHVVTSVKLMLKQKSLLAFLHHGQQGLLQDDQGHYHSSIKKSL